jgi:flagellin-like hook-associated protein FlgL
MMSNQFLTESNEALNRVAKYQSQVDSTKRLHGIADDPQSTLLALRAKNKLSNLALYKSNISTASSYLKEAESATSALNELLQSAYDDMVSAQGARTPEDMKIYAENIRNLRDEVLSISNTSLGTSYIFGGYNYTGKTDGVSKEPPFSVDGVTGDLIYNGINLSQFSWKDDFGRMTGLMSDLRDNVGDLTAEFATALGDSKSKSKAESILGELNKLVSGAKEAMDAAKEFGVDPDSANFLDFKTFYNDISNVAKSLESEVNRDLAGDYILDTAATHFKDDGSIDYEYYASQGKSVYTADELANKYSVARTQTVLDDAALFLTGAPATMDTVIDNLSGDVSILPDVETAIVDEASHKTILQIGTSQTADVTLTGLELLGTGENNIYHILGKAVSLLDSGGSPEALGKMLTSLQNAQSNILTIGTKIGATQNRMTLIGNRYESSELNYTQMRSNAEDADMAEAIINLTEAKTVYNAALAGGAELLKTSLIDFLR